MPKDLPKSLRFEPGTVIHVGNGGFTIKWGGDLEIDGGGSVFDPPPTPESG
jgi:hypothetical protein